MSERDAAPDRVRDPVCGMVFRPEKAVAELELEGRTIYFCTQACRRQFEEDPGRYLARNDGIA